MVAILFYSLEGLQISYYTKRKERKYPIMNGESKQQTIIEEDYN